jgi:hypothetical protein
MCDTQSYLLIKVATTNHEKKHTNYFSLIIRLIFDYVTGLGSIIFSFHM